MSLGTVRGVSAVDEPVRGMPTRYCEEQGESEGAKYRADALTIQAFPQTATVVIVSTIRAKLTMKRFIRESLGSLQM